MKVSIALSALLVMFCSFSSIGETNTTETVVTNKNYPKAFVIGQNSAIFEALNDSYSILLLTACNDDMNQAFSIWKNTLSTLEQHAHLNGVSLDGVKMWVKIFWGKSGNIEHIAFDLKPQSKKVKKEDLTALFKSFIEEYEHAETELTAEKNFSHYGSAAFPMHNKSVYAD